MPETREREYYQNYAHLLSQDEEGVFLIIRIIERGGLRSIRKEWLNEDILTRPGHLGVTALHAAAKVGVLKDLPEEFLTVENLALRDQEGYRPFDMAALHGHLDQIPRAAWDPAVVFDNADRCSVVHFATLFRPPSTEQFPLDLEVPEEFRNEFSDQWWEKHLKVMKHLKWKPEAVEATPACSVAVQLG